MNKKIFTLLVGACVLAGSLFTVNAQSQSPYKMKDHAEPNDVSFNDVLTADTLKKLPANHKDYYYLLSITGIANPSSGITGSQIYQDLTAGLHSRDLSYVLFADDDAIDDAYLRIDSLSALDFTYDYLYSYNGNTHTSSKFGAIRRASWCLDYETSGVDGSNVMYDFHNMETGRLLEAPYWSKEDAALWTVGNDANRYYNEKINAFDENLIVSGWHFSQVYTSTQNLQTGMPLYSYVKTDSVLVLALNEVAGYEPANGEKGGYTVTVKFVAYKDLIKDAAGNVWLRTDGNPNPVENVLLFTLKKLNKFVMNADDWNSVSYTKDGISFNNNPTNTVKNGSTEYKNIITETQLYAYEVRDSLYHYGYMQFAKNSTSNQYLYVDTAFANDGNSMNLAFQWGARRDSTFGFDGANYHDHGGYKWGDGFTTGRANSQNKPKPIFHDGYYCDATGATTPYDAFLYYDSIVVMTSTSPWNPAPAWLTVGDTIHYSYAYTPAGVAVASPTNKPGGPDVSWSTIGTALDAANCGSFTVNPAYPRTYSQSSWYADSVQFTIDSVKFLHQFYTDSLMENQSKFRVVYDPFADSTFINAYQTRVAHPNYENGINNATWPNWWENSFVMDPAGGTPAGVWMPHYTLAGTRAGDYAGVQANVYGLYSQNSLRNPYSNTANATAAYSWHNLFDYRTTDVLLQQHDAHSFMLKYEKSRYSDMDVVMISTADTVAIYEEYFTHANVSALSHMYGFSIRATEHDPYYRDSLVYVDIQSLTGSSSIITLDQLYKNGAKMLDTQIKLNYGPKCKDTEDDDKATIANDLYLIRNKHGQYLSVPIWSITDSVYWANPEEGEDLTRIPSYQWAVVNLRNSERSPFRLINREFEKVEFPYTYVYESNDHPFVIGKPYNMASFNDKVVYSGVTKTALEIGDVSAANFVAELRQKFPLEDGISFIRLGKSVKQDQLLGYKYVDPDSTIVDVYAFKYLSGMAMGDDARYLGWYGDDETVTPKDTAVYAHFQSYYDKVYFDLQEMEKEHISDEYTDIYKNGRLWLNSSNTASGKENADYADLYKKLVNKERKYVTNAEGFMFERFGYYESNVITDLKPLARQAYRLMLQDYYRWHPTIKGHYMVVGQSDTYILSDRVNAVKRYVSGSGRVEGLFGLPHFYFRNTYFDVQHAGDDYFALVQRLDTVSEYNDYTYDWGGGTYGDVKEYLTMTFGSTAANKVLKQIIENRELGVFIAVVEDAYAPLKMVVRGDAGVRVSTFQLEQDHDPIYRRFHVNEPSGNFYPEMGDQPDTLEFHVLNDGEKGYRLYENSGNYKDADQTDLYGASGGRVYNRENDGHGDYYRDTLGNVISFLGINRNTQYGANTNYAIYVDTAYVNRGTGWIKPQYMLVVDPYIPEECGVCNPATGNNEGANEDYVIGRYMFNTAMYAKSVKSVVYDDDYNDFEANKTTIKIDGKDVVYYRSNNFSKVQPIDPNVDRNPNGKAYQRGSKWERLAFSWAIHKGDTLYVLKGIEPLYNDNFVNDPADVWQKLTEEYGSKGSYVDFGKLVKDNSVGTYTEAYYPLGNRNGDAVSREYHTFRSMDAVRAAGKTIGLQAIVRLDDNTHKDWVFSMRYIERRSDDFVIESETTDRDTRYGAMIRPGYGGWVKFDNEVPFITRSDAKELQIESYGAVFNVNRLKQNPVDNETIDTDASAVKVIGGTGNVTILNATGKSVVISNILGQTVANVTLNSDNASVAIPAGVVVVAIEGEKAVKAVVK